MGTYAARRRRLGKKGLRDVLCCRPAVDANVDVHDTYLQSSLERINHAREVQTTSLAVPVGVVANLDASGREDGLVVAPRRRGHVDDVSQRPSTS